MVVHHIPFKKNIVFDGRNPPQTCQMHLEVLCHCQLAGLLKLGSAIAKALFAFLG